MKMNKCKIIIVLVLIFFLNHVSLKNLNAEAKLNDPAKELLKKMNEATQAEKLKFAKSVYFKMSMTIADANLTGTTEITATSNKAYMKILLAGTETEMGYDGKTAWSKDITQGLREISGYEKESVIQSTIDVIRDPKAYYNEIVMASDEKFEGKDCFVLTLKKEGLSDKKIFVDKKTYLPSGSLETQDTPQGKMTVKSIINSYKKLENGFLMVDSITHDMGIMKMKMAILEAKIDATVDDKKFKQPEN
jgi:hypothetical protein